MHKGPQRRRPIVEMNLIPLIDVSLILVIIFMVLTPVLVQYQLTVRLPSASEGSPSSTDTAVQIEIARNGRVSVDGRPVKNERLEEELRLRLGRAAQKTVLVQADKAVPVEQVVWVLDAAKRLGVGKLGIGVAQAQ